MRSLFLATLTTSFLLVSLLVGGALGAPTWDQPSVVTQPDGTKSDVRMFGDEFYNWMESPDGYTVVRDSKSGWVCYAEISSDGSQLVSTGVQMGETPPVSLEPGIRLDDAAIIEIAETAYARIQPGSMEKILDLPPVTHGQVAGITILVDFSDLDFETEVPDPADQQAWIDEVYDYLNLAGYSGNGNNGSVYDYFKDVSGDALHYYNQLTTKFYESTATRASLEADTSSWPNVVTSILQQMDSEGFEFGQYDSNDDGMIDAINIFYWGPPGSGDLWPHYTDGISVTLDGLQAEHFQVSSLGTFPQLRVFCHENGHMLGQWHDLYSILDPKDGYGLGNYCLMAYGGNVNRDPVHPSAYPKMLAGWMDPIVLDSPGTDFLAQSGNNTGYIIPHPDPSITREFFLIENRQELGRDTRIGDSGLAIYHVDENRLQRYSDHYRVHLVQADGLWQLENQESFGNSTDLFSAPGFENYGPFNDPRAEWWAGDFTESTVQNVSASGPVMTFDYPGCSQLVSVTMTPADLGFEWVMTGPDGFSCSGTADNEFIVPTSGDYTVEFEAIPLYNTPAPITLHVGNESEPAEFAASYAITIIHGGSGDLGDMGNATAISAVDYDQDGDADLFIANSGTPNRLLINTGTSGFVESAPANLSAAAGVVDASWADADNDGDQDLFLVRGPGQHMVLENQGTTLADISSSSADLCATGAASAGNWADIDNDGLLDLFLARSNDPNKVYEGATGSPFQLLPGTISPFAASGTASSGGHWGDIHNDGWNDLLVTGPNSPYDTSLLFENCTGDLNFWSGHVNSLREGIDASWADFNNDGIMDIAVLNSSGYAICYLIDANGYVHTNWLLPYGLTTTSLTVGDFNNDGWIDFYATRTGESDVLALNLLRTAGSLNLHCRNLTFNEDDFTGDNKIALAEDFNGDGRLDLYVARDGAPNFLIENQAGGANHWLEVDLTGVTGNRDALGARVTVVAGGLSLIREVQSDGGAGQNSKMLHFGLGTATTVDLITVRWPGSGPTQYYTGAVAVDTRISITQINVVPTISSYIARNGSHLPLPGNNLRGCPAGDAGDTLVVQVDFDDASMAGIPQILPSQIDLFTDGLGYEFYDDSSLDSAGTPANGYTVTLRRSHIGGCGLCEDTGCNDPTNDPLPLGVGFEGMPIGSIADLRVQSVDISGDGRVNLLDNGLLASAYFSSPETGTQYYCVDFDNNGSVNLSDISFFASHYGHLHVEASSDSGPEIVSNALVRFLPDGIVNAVDRSLRVRVVLESPDAINTVAAVIDGRVGSYRVIDWEADPSLGNQTILMAREKSANQEWLLMGSDLEKESSLSLELGTLILAPLPDTGSVAKSLSEEDFKILFGEVLKADGSVELLAQTEGGNPIPVNRSGMQRVFPNPFNPVVTIEYALNRPAQVTLQIHDLAGRLVATLVNEYQAPQGGVYSAMWKGTNSNGRRTPSGVYFWRLAIGDQVETGRMTLIK